MGYKTPRWALALTIIMINQSTVHTIVDNVRALLSINPEDVIVRSRKSTLLCSGVLLYVVARSFTSPLSSVHQLLPRVDPMAVGFFTTLTMLGVLFHTFACWSMIEKQSGWGSAVKSVTVGDVEQGVVGTSEKPTLYRISCEATGDFALWLRAVMSNLGRHVTLGLLTCLVAVVTVILSYAFRSTLHVTMRFGFADTVAQVANRTVRRYLGLTSTNSEGPSPEALGRGTDVAQNCTPAADECLHDRAAHSAPPRHLEAGTAARQPETSASSPPVGSHTCGDEGGRNGAGRPCGTLTSNGERCQHHRAHAASANDIEREADDSTVERRNHRQRTRVGTGTRSEPVGIGSSSAASTDDTSSEDSDDGPVRVRGGTAATFSCGATASTTGKPCRRHVTVNGSRCGRHAALAVSATTARQRHNGNGSSDGNGNGGTNRNCVSNKRGAAVRQRSRPVVATATSAVARGRRAVRGV